MSLFENYPNDPNHIPGYIAYQARYANNARESDKFIIELLRRHPSTERRLLDIGCSTGNLLRHIRHALPELDLTGGDLSDAQLLACRSDETLNGIAFEHMDIKKLPPDSFDILIANAVLYGFGDADFAVAMASISRSLRPGGMMIAFDFFHAFDQDVDLVERSDNFPMGHPLNFRSFRTTKRHLIAASFSKFDFLPFNIPIKLAAKDHPLQTRTVEAIDHPRLMFRGIIAQPWCHMIAYKSLTAP